jgi:transposase-like protein
LRSLVRSDAVARGCVSPFEIVLTAEERRELEGRARAYTASYAQVVRAKIVLFAAEGMANVDIAFRLDTSPQVVHRWRKRFFEQRLKGLAGSVPGPARPNSNAPTAPRWWRAARTPTL